MSILKTGQAAIFDSDAEAHAQAQFHLCKSEIAVSQPSTVAVRRFSARHVFEAFPKQGGETRMRTYGINDMNGDSARLNARHSTQLPFEVVLHLQAPRLSLQHTMDNTAWRAPALFLLTYTTTALSSSGALRTPAVSCGQKLVRTD